MYDSFKYDGSHIATINGHCTFLLYFNKDIFDMVGLDYPTPDWTWDDFLYAAQRTTINDGVNRTWGFILPGSSFFIYPFIYSFGGSIYDNPDAPTAVTVNNPNTVEALRFLQDLVHVYEVAPRSFSMEEIGGGFDTGMVAMDIVGVWSNVASAAIFVFMFHWNDFFGPLIFITQSSMRTAALALFYLRGSMEVASLLPAQMAAALVTLIPCVLIFYFLQRYFIAGIVIKGVEK